jgi:hypothetical protein
VLHDVALAEGLLYLEVVLPGGRMLQRLDEDADSAARFMHSTLHFAVLLGDGEDFRFRARADVLAGQGVIRSNLRGEAGEECADENGGKKMLHGSA